MFYAGLAMVIVGGPGLIFAAIAHDPFGVPLVGTAYGVFGPLHFPYIVAGAILVFIGLVTLRTALRSRPDSEPEGVS